MKQIWALITVLVLCLFIGELSAQSDSSWQKAPAVELFGFADVFYAYNSSQHRQAFFYNHNRHNEFNLNLALLKVAVQHPKYRANVALQAGTYPNDNYAAEPGLLQALYEANVGLSLSKTNKLWLDVGVFSSHLGFESAMSIDNPTLTRSLLAESSPYYLSGAKLTYTPTVHWEMAALITNGWQRIQRLEGNSLLSFGTQLIYRPSNTTTLNWSTFIGTDTPDTTRQMRYFSDLYGQFKLTKKLAVTLGFDLGAQQKSMESSDYALWLCPTFIGQYSFNQSWKAAVRAEYYEDANGIIVPTGTANGFQTSGVSLNVDYSPTPNVMCRLEGRWFESLDKVFETSGAPTDQQFMLVSSIAIRFGKRLSN